MSTCCSIMSLSLINVTAFSSELGRLRKFLAQSYCLCPFLQPHNIKRSPLHLSNLQRHREQAGVQQERGCLLGTTRVCQLSGTRSGSPHSLLQPERKIGHSSHQPTGHTLHPAVPQVHSETQHYAHQQASPLCLCLSHAHTHTQTNSVCVRLPQFHLCTNIPTTKLCWKKTLFTSYHKLKYHKHDI